MAQQTRFRRQNTVDISNTSLSNRVVSLLSRGMTYRELVLRLRGSVTFSAAAQNTAANLRRGDEWAIFDRIDLIANGADVIRTFSGPDLVQINRMLYGANRRVSAKLGDATNATVDDIDSTLTLPLWMPLAIRPLDTALDSNNLSDLRLEFQLGSATGLSAGTISTYGLKLDVGSYESFGVDGKFTSSRMYKIQTVVPGANNQQQIQLPVTCVYRGFFINIANGSGNSAADNGGTGFTTPALENVRLISGTTVFRDIPARMLKDWQAQRLNFNREMVTAASSGVPVGGFVSNNRSALSSEDGWYFLDLCQDGFMSEGIDAAGLSELYLELNLSAGCTVSVIPVQLFPLRG